MTETVFTNAQLVLPQEVVRGSLVIRNGQIAPNVIRGGSHSGNVAATDLAATDRLDILSSDYVPAALLMGAVQLADGWNDLARGIRAVTAAPARYLGLNDRGQMRTGLGADLIRLRRIAAAAALMETWVAGQRGA